MLLWLLIADIHRVIECRFPALSRVAVSPTFSPWTNSAGLGLQPHIETIAQKGLATWQRTSGYNFRSYVELAMQRYKRIFGNAMKARALARQKTEAWISASALNTMTSFGMPVSVKI